MELKITKQFITPSIAKAYLDSNPSNRRISKPMVLRYANDMMNGKWKEDTGETMKFSKSGRLLDGQHRLYAVVKANVTICFHVAFNVDESSFDVIDTGKGRNATDCFTIAGIKSYNKIPSIISYYNLLEQGKRQGQQLNIHATNAKLLEQYYEDEIFWQNTGRNAQNWYIAFAKILPPSFIGGFYAHFYNINPEKAEMFMNQLCTGSDISNQTINLLRKKLIQDKMSIRKMPPNLKMAFIIKTWNNFITGNNIKILRFDPESEKFPVAINPTQNTLKF